MSTRAIGTDPRAVSMPRLGVPDEGRTTSLHHRKDERRSVGRGDQLRKRKWEFEIRPGESLQHVRIGDPVVERGHVVGVNGRMAICTVDSVVSGDVMGRWLGE